MTNQELVDLFNSLFPIGSMVSLRKVTSEQFPYEHHKLIGCAFLDVSGEPVAFFKGISGYFSIRPDFIQYPPKAQPTVVISWEDKSKMIALGNVSERSPEDKEAFQKFVLSNMCFFDGQAWDMFVNLVQILPSKMKEDIAFWTEIYQLLKDIDCNDKAFGFRSGMRIAVIQTFCEDELKLT